MIVFFMESLNRKSGGASSILDLANRFIDLGEEVIIYSVLGKLDLFIYKPLNVNNKIKIYPMWFECLQNYKKNKKKIINKTLNLFNRKELSKNFIIIDAFRLPENFIKKLKGNNNIIILNHAGSPNAFIKYFGMNGSKRKNYETALKEYKELVNRYDLYWFQSPSQAKELSGLMGYDSEKTIVLTPGIDEKLLKNAQKIKEFEGFYNITIVGSVHERKGQHFVPEILKNIEKYIPNVMFHIVGPIVDKQYIRKLQSNDKIKLYDFRRDYLNFINSADIVLQLSEEEGVSRILRESMILGKPIIAFELEGTNDLLVNGEDAILVPYGDIKSISKAILKLQKDKKLRQKLSENAKKNYLEKYSSNVYLKNLKNILKRLHEFVLR